MADCQQVVRGGGSKTAHVYFHNEERVGVKQLRLWVEASSADSIIIVSLEGPTSFTRREAEQNYPQVQFFQYRDVCVNITKHQLVPKHEKISKLPFETSDNMAEIPILYTTDKIAQYYNYGQGDLIRVTRTCGVQEPVYFYRIVRAPPAA